MGLPLLGYLSQSGRQIIGGIAQEFITELEKSGDSFGHQRCPMHNSITLIHPDKFKLLALKMCLDAGVRLLLHSELCDTVTDNGKLTRVSVIGKGTRVDIDADVFIDGTGDGDLGFMAGARYEKSNELQPPTTMFALTGFHKEEFMRFLDEHPENMAQLDSVHIDPGYDTTLWRSTDSYAATRGSDGPFTGAADYLGSPLFFKEDCIERVYPSAAGAHQIVTVRCPGVRKGSGRSLQTEQGGVTGSGRLRDCVLHVRPRRCRRLRLRLYGVGGCRVYSLTAVYEKGSDGP